MQKHTYIFQEGTWEVHGNYYDQRNEFDVYSETTTLHLENEWILESCMQLVASETHRFYSKYFIKPMNEGADFTTWISNNPSLGTMRGNFMIIGDTILSVYKSDNGVYSGFEMFLRINDDKYLNRGYSLKNDVKLASWEVVLIRIDI